MADLLGGDHVFVKMPNTHGSTSVCFDPKNWGKQKTVEKRILVVFRDHKYDDFGEK